MDLTTGWNFDLKADRDRARQLLQDTRPKLLIGSPECKMFSNLQNMTKWTEEKEHKRNAAMNHLNFVCDLYREQVNRGGWFLHEHPVAASSWRSACVLGVMKLEGLAR